MVDKAVTITVASGATVAEAKKGFSAVDMLSGMMAKGVLVSQGVVNKVKEYDQKKGISTTTTQKVRAGMLARAAEQRLDLPAPDTLTHVAIYHSISPLLTH